MVIPVSDYLLRKTGLVSFADEDQPSTRHDGNHLLGAPAGAPWIDLADSMQRASAPGRLRRHTPSVPQTLTDTHTTTADPGSASTSGPRPRARDDLD